MKVEVEVEVEVKVEGEGEVEVDLWHSASPSAHRPQRRAGRSR